MINMLFRSAGYHNRDSLFSVLTSPETDLSGVNWDFERVDVPIHRETLMLDRMEGQRRMARDLRPGETLLFLDSDILVQSDLSCLEDDFADVAVTWRRASVPINGGFILVRNNGRGSSDIFFAKLLEIFRTYYNENRQWNGDQMALRDFLPTGRLWNGDTVLSPCPGLRVRLLHSDIYNYSPPDDPQEFVLPALRDRAILHFKGNRKRFMADYFDALLATATTSYA